jgi:hypothetical protein
MKKKKLKKIAKIIYSHVSTLKRSTSHIREKVDYLPFDGDVSKKTKNLILNLISYNENVNINFSDDEFVISAYDITNIKKKQSGNTTLNDDNYLEIVVTKDGFSLNYAYSKRSHYKDKSIYSDLIDTVKEKVKEVNRQNFTEIWDKVMKESGIIRDNNLEQLFDE